MNATEMTVDVTVDGSYIFTLQPGQHRGYTTRDVFLPDRIQACSGNVLIHDETITWEEVQENDFTYVIDGTIESPPDPSRPPQQNSAAAKATGPRPC